MFGWGEAGLSGRELAVAGAVRLMGHGCFNPAMVPEHRADHGYSESPLAIRKPCESDRTFQIKSGYSAASPFTASSFKSSKNMSSSADNEPTMMDEGDDEWFFDTAIAEGNNEAFMEDVRATIQSRFERDLDAVAALLGGAAHVPAVVRLVHDGSKGAAPWRFRWRC